MLVAQANSRSAKAISADCWSSEKNATVHGFSLLFQKMLVGEEPVRVLNETAAGR